MNSIHIDIILEGRVSKPNQLIEVLHDVQEFCGYIPEGAMRRISKSLGVPMIEVYRVASFYKAFSLKPQGRHSVTVCMGTACHVRGSPKLLEKVVETLRINPDETSNDRRFSLATVNCLGCCAIGPVVTVDNRYYSNPTSENLGKLFRGFD